MAELPNPFLPPKGMLESEIARLKAENERLEAEKDRIHEDREALRSRVSELEQSNTHLQQELERLRAEISEKDSLLSDLGWKEEEQEGPEKLESINEEALFRLGELRRERDALLEEKKEMERKFELMEEESASIVQSMLVAQTDLQERLERERESGRKKNASFRPKGAAAMVRSLTRKWRRRNHNY
ncbi:hypothetical protein ACLOJK_003062 [Asimina triloba]